MPPQGKHAETNNAIETIPSVTPELINFGASTSVDVYNDITESIGETMQYTDLMPKNTDSLNWSQNRSLEVPNNIRLFKSTKFCIISLLPKYFIHTDIIFLNNSSLN